MFRDALPDRTKNNRGRVCSQISSMLLPELWLPSLWRSASIKFTSINIKLREQYQTAMVLGYRAQRFREPLLNLISHADTNIGSSEPVRHGRRRVKQMQPLWRSAHRSERNCCLTTVLLIGLLRAMAWPTA